MNRVGEGPRRWAIVAAAALTVRVLPAVATIGSAPAAAAAATDAGLALQGAGAPGPLLLAAGLFALVLALAAAALGALLMRRRLAEALREARGERQVLAGLLDDWAWRSDAGHQLLHLTPPRGAPAGHWVAATAAGACLWERFRPLEGNAEALRARLEARRGLDELVVEVAPAAAGAVRWRLRGEPLFDGDGRFTGYLGTARPLDEAAAPQPAPTSGAVPAGDLPTRAARASPADANPAPASQAPAPVDDTKLQVPAWLPAMAQVLDLLPAAAFAGLGEGPQWRLSYLNAAAQALLGLEGDPPAWSWAELVDRLPEACRAAAGGLLAAAAPGAAAASGEHRHADAAGWVLTLQSVPAGAREPAVQWLTVAGPPEAAAPAAATASTPAPAPVPAQAPPPAADTDTAVSDQEAFSYTVSHDLRAPIRVVEGFTRIVKEDYGRVLDRIGIDHLDRVLGAAARMNNMIDALLDLSRLSSQPLSRRPVNLSQLAGYVVDELRRGAPEREVEVEIQPGMTTSGDPTMLRVALENLLGNAWKYSARTPRARIVFEVAGPAERPVYCVRDNGAGFDMRFADRLFGIFQRLHSASDFTGTGIGLASVRRIVHRHGGEIWAEGEVGQGARFYFTLRG